MKTTQANSSICVFKFVLLLLISLLSSTARGQYACVLPSGYKAECAYPMVSSYGYSFGTTRQVDTPVETGGVYYSSDVEAINADIAGRNSRAVAAGNKPCAYLPPLPYGPGWVETEVSSGSGIPFYYVGMQAQVEFVGVADCPYNNGVLVNYTSRVWRNRNATCPLGYQKDSNRGDTDLSVLCFRPTNSALSGQLPFPRCNAAVGSSVDSGAAGKFKKVLDPSSDSVTFYSYDTLGREVERATFPSAVQDAVVRPALTGALSVTSTRWHPTWHLIVATAEPNKRTETNYDAKGKIASYSRTATDDATGALAFEAHGVGNVTSTGWMYDDRGLPTVTQEYVGSTLSGSWSRTYDGQGRLASLKDDLTGRFGTATAYDASGRLLSGISSTGRPFAFTYDASGKLLSYSNDGSSLRFGWTSFGAIERIDGPGTDLVVYEYDAAQQLTGVQYSVGTAAMKTVPIPNGPIPNFGRTLPVPVDPDDALLPATPFNDAERDIARRLGEAIQWVIGRLLCSEECRQLQAVIQERTNDLKKRSLDMYVDKNNLYCTNPQGGRQNWKTHQDKYDQLQLNLNRLIAKAKGLKCPYNPEADVWAVTPKPVCPDEL